MQATIFTLESIEAFELSSMDMLDRSGSERILAFFDSEDIMSDTSTSDIRECEDLLHFDLVELAPKRCQFIENDEASAEKPLQTAMEDVIMHQASAYRILDARSEVRQMTAMQDIEISHQFPCQEAGCNRSYAKKNHLRRHMFHAHPEKVPELFTAERLCNVCGEYIYDTNRRKYHIDAHFKIKTFRCPVPGCNKVFNQKGNLNRHRKSVHAKKQL